MTSSTLRSYGYLALCILLWASIPVVSKKILVEMSNLQMLFWSTIFSAVVLGGVLVAQGLAPALGRTSGSVLARMVVRGFLGCFLYYVLLYGALARTSAAEGFLLAYTWPILVSVLAVWLLGERWTTARLLAVVVSFGGVVIIATQGAITQLAVTSLSGDLLALGGALVFALFSVLGKGARGEPTISAFVYFVTALICVSITVALVSSVPRPSAAVWPWLVYNGVLVNGITYVWWFKALEHGDTFVVSNALYLTPFLSLLYIYWFLGEPILASHVVGLAVIVLGIGIQSWWGRRRPALE